MAQYEAEISFHTWETLSGERMWECTGRQDPCDTYEAAYAHARQAAEEELALGSCDEYKIFVYTVEGGEDVAEDVHERGRVVESQPQPVSDAHRAANARYDKRATRQVKLKLNVYTDEDILAWLDAQPNKQGALKALIRREIAAAGGHCDS